MDTPTAFASTLEEESARPADTWERAAASQSSGADSVTFIAETDTRWIGLVGAFRNTERPDVVDLVSMWVTPAYRGSGVGRRLIDEVVDWARGNGNTAVELWVTRGNDPAISLYTRAGFALTDDHKPLPSDPCHDELRMVLYLSEDSGG